MGPSKWQPDHDPKLPAWIQKELPDDWTPEDPDRLQPIDVRAALCEHLDAEGIAATMMEFHEKQPGRTNTELFQAIEQELDVGRYFVYWPYGAQGVGVDWELGALTDRIAAGRRLDVRLFIEETAGTIRGDELEIQEAGRGTQYYHDLMPLGCPVVEWESYEVLFGAVGYHADP